MTITSLSRVSVISAAGTQQLKAQDEESGSSLLHLLEALTKSHNKRLPNAPGR